jgi:hypothetical protein
MPFGVGESISFVRHLMKLPSDDEFKEGMSPVINRLDERK